MKRRGRGHIAVVELDDNGKASAPRPVLEREYHLSYPFLFEWEGELYMIPESAANRTIDVYRCARFPDQWSFHRTVMSDVNAVDATVEEIDGRWWMFVTMTPRPGLKNVDELHLFHAETPLGPWLPHRRNPVKVDVRSARPAGRLFRWQGDLYRPAQDCSVKYGYAVTFNRVERIDTAEYLETPVSSMLPHWADNLSATHTFNANGSVVAIDGLRRRSRWWPSRG